MIHEEAVEKWRRDAAASICAGTGMPLKRLGLLFGTCRLCGHQFVGHDDNNALAWRHVEATGPGMVVQR